MSENRKIKTALISVYNKTGVDDLADALVSNGVNIISTGELQNILLTEILRLN